MAGQDKEKSADTTVDELTGFNDEEQAELIANHYANISKQYEVWQYFWQVIIVADIGKKSSNNRHIKWFSTVPSSR